MIQAPAEKKNSGCFFFPIYYIIPYGKFFVNKAAKKLAKKSRKKLTENQKIWNRIINNAKRVYNRLKKLGYHSDRELEQALKQKRPAVVTKTRLQDLERELRYQSIYSKMYGTDEYGEMKSYRRMSRAERKSYEAVTKAGPVIPGGVNEADMLWSEFLRANEHWDTDNRTHQGWTLIVLSMVRKRSELQNQYGKAVGDAIFAELLDEIGAPNYAVTSAVADNPNEAAAWITGIFSMLRTPVELRSEIDNSIG